MNLQLSCFACKLTSPTGSALHAALVRLFVLTKQTKKKKVRLKSKHRETCYVLEH